MWPLRNRQKTATARPFIRKRSKVQDRNTFMKAQQTKTLFIPCLQISTRPTILSKEMHQTNKATVIPVISLTKNQEWLAQVKAAQTSSKVCPRNKQTATLRRNQAPSPPTQALMSLLRTLFNSKVLATLTQIPKQGLLSRMEKALIPLFPSLKAHTMLFPRVLFTSRMEVPLQASPAPQCLVSAKKAGVSYTCFVQFF